MSAPGYVELIEAALNPDDGVTLALAGVIALAPLRQPPYDVPIAGLNAPALAALKERYFADGAFPLHARAGSPPDATRFDEFEDLVCLLLEHRRVADRESAWLAYAIATACMGENHLWQDMGLPNRSVLSGLMKRHFTALAMRNIGDMKWKKFFYRQLCERAAVMACKSPSCGVCTDYAVCFGPEEAENGLGQEAAAVVL